MQTAVVVLSNERAVLQVNAAAADLLGVSRQRLLGAVPEGSPSVGRVISQSPGAFEEVEIGTVITITVGEAAPPTTTTEAPTTTTTEAPTTTTTEGGGDGG